MFSERIINSLAGGSAIRAMFEQGNLLKAKYGDENVYDFALGNPDPEPPQSVIDDIIKLAGKPGIHKYMPNAGFEGVREKIASEMQIRSGVPYTKNNIIMVAGAAAGLSIAMNALLNPGDEVIVIAPFFGEYRPYVTNFGGRLVPVPSVPDTFEPDIPAIENAISDSTKAIIINSPNNPSGAVYSEETLNMLCMAVKRAEKRTGNTIYLISDEPYSKIIYDGVRVPDVDAIFENSIIVNSFSKSLALPGERIGYVAVNPAIENADILMDALIYCARTLGFVNAPGLFQEIAASHMHEAAGLDDYRARRDELYKVITGAGFECMLPKGAFYLFPKSPIPDDVEFCRMALKHNIVAVSGTSFGYAGYFRLAYCVSMSTIKNSEGAFRALMDEVSG